MERHRLLRVLREHLETQLTTFCGQAVNNMHAILRLLIPPAVNELSCSFTLSDGKLKHMLTGQPARDPSLHSQLYLMSRVTLGCYFASLDSSVKGGPAL